VRSVSALKDLSELLISVVLLAILFLVRPGPAVSPTFLLVADATFVALESIDIPSEAFAIRLLRFRPPWMLLVDFLSSVPGLVRSLALLVSFVLGAETLGAALRVSFSDFVVVTESFFSILIVCFLRVRSASVRLGELLIATLGCFFTAAGGDFGLLIRVAICEVLGELVRAGGFGAGFDGFGAERAAGDLTGRTDVVIREVFAGLIRFGGAGFGAFGALRTAGGLGALRLGVTLGAGGEALGGTERGADRLGLGALALADERGWLLRCGRAAALGAGWGLLGRATLAAGARLLPTFEGLLVLAAGADF
jgi:hypothetical protein